MFQKFNLKILNIDSDGNATGKIQNKNVKNKIIKIDFKKDNITFKEGDLVVAHLIKLSGKTNIKILRKIKESDSFYAVVLQIKDRYITIKKILNSQNQNYYIMNSKIKKSIFSLIKKNSLIKVKTNKSKKNDHFNEFLNECELLNVYGRLTDTKLFPLIAIDEFLIDNIFSNKELIEAKQLQSKSDNKDNRINLEKLNFITIDDEDAKDFDDAIYAEKLNNKKWKIIVSISDVSFYIKPNSHLDKKAKLRGNSIYFPNYVVPMLPEEISNKLCSLKQNEIKLCLSVEIIISKDENKMKYKFFKSVIKPKKRFTYNEIQKLIENKDQKQTLISTSIFRTVQDIYEVYQILKEKSFKRGCLNLNIPEKKFVLNEKNIPIDIEHVKNLESYNIIEEFMVLANVCAAEELTKDGQNNVYRIHEKPSTDKINYLIKTLGKPYRNVLRNNFSTITLNTILEKEKKENSINFLSQVILRAQSQAKYDNVNRGHFGLALKKYVHFTSPIRRYSDLLVHRKLSKIIDKDFSKKDYDNDELKLICKHISSTERIAIEAERKTFDRMLAFLFSKSIKKEFTGSIISIKKFGIFVNFNQNLVEGLIHKKNLPRDRYIYNESLELLEGIHTSTTFKTGMKLRVKILDTDIMAGNISLEFVKLL